MFLLIKAKETEIGWLLGCSKSEGCEYGFVLFCFSGKKVWMNEKQEIKKADKKGSSGSKFTQILSQEERWAFS